MLLALPLNAVFFNDLGLAITFSSTEKLLLSFGAFDIFLVMLLRPE